MKQLQGNVGLVARNVREEAKTDYHHHRPYKPVKNRSWAAPVAFRFVKNPCIWVNNPLPLDYPLPMALLYILASHPHISEEPPF